MAQYTNVFSQSPVQPSGSSYNQINLTEDITLQWPTSFQDVSTITGNIMDVVADDNDPFFVLSLPNATQVSPGTQMIINNAGGNSFTLSDNAGGELVGDFQVGHVWQIYLTDNSTAAGAWGIIPSGAGVAGVTRVEAETTSDGLTITGSPITGSGTLGFELSDNLNALSDLNSTGYMVETAANTFNTRQLVAGTGMSILNADGVAGNTTLSVNTTLNGMVSIGVGNLNLANNSITSTNGDGNIAITPNGTGSVTLGSNISPVTIDTNNDITGINSWESAEATFGNIGINTNTISATNLNGDILIQPNGSGNFNVQADNGDVNLTTNGGGFGITARNAIGFSISGNQGPFTFSGNGSGNPFTFGSFNTPTTYTFNGQQQTSATSLAQFNCAIRSPQVPAALIVFTFSNNTPGQPQTINRSYISQGGTVTVIFAGSGTNASTFSVQFSSPFPSANMVVNTMMSSPNTPSFICVNSYDETILDFTAWNPAGLSAPLNQQAHITIYCL